MKKISKEALVTLVQFANLPIWTPYWLSHKCTMLVPHVFIYRQPSNSFKLRIQINFSTWGVLWKWQSPLLVEFLADSMKKSSTTILIVRFLVTERPQKCANSFNATKIRQNAIYYLKYSIYSNFLRHKNVRVGVMIYWYSFCSCEVFRLKQNAS